MIWFDWTIIIMIPAILLGLIVQIRLSTTYSKYSKVQSRTGMTGYTAARRILDAAGLRHVPIECIQGELTDHFDPRSNVLRLSNGVYNSSSVAAIGVAAHECGHAIQYAEEYTPMKVRGALVKVTNFSSSISMFIVILGLIFSFRELALVGVALFSVVVLFQLVTLPVEFNASRRAVKILDGYMDREELSGVKSVLSAAAMTYVAALVSAIFQLIRLLAIVGGGRDRK
ncbi:MAG: zinc metallopeptidase [Eubacteriales bacterium]|nr:zinc metallopeptidase [Clostridiales bacterium]HCH68599.1 peptidase [Clostridiales bacterium]